VADLANLMIIVQQFLPLDQLEVEFELVLDEGGDKDEPVSFLGLGEDEPDGNLQEIGLFGDIGELLRQDLHFPLDGVSLAGL
jgi:hypothetical protein